MGIYFHLDVCFSDYRRIAHLDRYERSELNDEEEFDDLDIGDRLAAERQMRKRDRDEAQLTGRMRRGLLYGKYFLEKYGTKAKGNSDL